MSTATSPYSSKGRVVARTVSAALAKDRRKLRMFFQTRATVKGPYAPLWSADVAQRIDWVKEGIPSAVLVVMASDMQVPREKLLFWSRISRATATRKLQAGAALSADEGERALGLARLIGQVTHVVQESGNPEGFDAATWTADWLEQPNPALGGKAPGQYMDTADGRELVSSLIARMQSGAYA